MIEAFRPNDDNILTPVVKYEYKYDKQRNWIRQVTFRKGEANEYYPDMIKERVITYYDPSS